MMTVPSSMLYPSHPYFRASSSLNFTYFFIYAISDADPYAQVEFRGETVAVYHVYGDVQIGDIVQVKASGCFHYPHVSFLGGNLLLGLFSPSG